MPRTQTQQPEPNPGLPLGSPEEKPKANGATPVEVSAATNGHVGADPLDPFDPANMSVDQSFLAQPATKKLLKTVPLRKPKDQFFRVHPTRRVVAAAIIEDKEERVLYYVTPSLAKQLQGSVALANLYQAITRQGVLFVWPVKTQQADGRSNEWHSTGLEAAELAMSRWVKITANMSLGAYVIEEALGTLSEPDWPEEVPFKDVLRLALRSYSIDDLDHPLLRRSRGEI